MEQETQTTTPEVTTPEVTAETNTEQVTPTVEAETTPTAENQEKTDAQKNSVPEAYDFTKFVGEGGELDEANATAFSEVLRSLNINQEGAEKLTTFGMTYLQKMGDAILDHIEAEQQAQAESWKQETVKALGGKFDSTIAKAGAGIEYLEQKVPELREVLTYNGIGNNLALVKVFSIIGDLVAEDTGKLGGTPTVGTDNFYDNTDWTQYK